MTDRTQADKTARNSLISQLQTMGITDAIADRNATLEGAPAIMLYQNGEEEMFTGFSNRDYREWLRNTFAD